MKKLNIVLLMSAGFVFCIIAFAAPANAAGTKKIGDQCTSNDDCVTETCATSDLSTNAQFCVCDTADQCAAQYGTKSNETWSCEDGEKISHDLDFCKSSIQGSLLPITSAENVIPIAPVKAPERTEKQTKTAPPTPIVPIPGAEKYSEVTVTPGEVASIPWIAQYIRGAYTYGIRLAAIIAVMMLMIGGILMISAGMNSSYFNTGKSIVISSIFGIILLASSYVILNSINPRLVTPEAISLDTLESAAIEIVEFSEVEDETAASQPTAPGTKPLPPGKTIAVHPTSVSEVTKDMFKRDSINGERNIDGWQLWQSYTAAEKAQIFPHLYKQVASCSPPSMVSVSGITGWSSKKIEPSVLPKFQQASSIANSLGFKFVPGSTFRDAGTNGVPLWNTGVVARYRQWKTGSIKSVTSTNWKSNQGKIGRPKCTSPHQTGGAIDINLARLSDGKIVLGATSTAKITSGNYDRTFSNNPYKVILEYIMNEAGFVRYCGEHWHFEYGVTDRYNRWDKQARCWGTTSTIDQPIPASTQQKVTQILGKNIF